MPIWNSHDHSFKSRLTIHWAKLEDMLGIKLCFSTAFHPQTDGQFEWTIQILEHIKRTYTLQFKGSWDERLSLVEFAYNNSYHSSIGTTRFEALYRRCCRMPVFVEEVGKRRLYGPELVHTTTKNIKITRENLKTTCNRQKSYVDNRRRTLEL